MINTKYVYEKMKEAVDLYGFEIMKKPDQRICHGVKGLYDEQTIFIATKKESKEIGEGSFIVFTFKELFLYERKDFRERCAESITYQNKEEMYEFLHRHAKVKDNWYENLFEEVREYISENCSNYIENENEKLIKLKLPYNHTASKEQFLFVYPGQLSLQTFNGGMYQGKWEGKHNKDFHNMHEFLKLMETFYEPQNIWV